MRDCNISLASGVVLDYEVKQSYRVTVEVTDGRDQNGDDDNDAIDETINVIVTVTDVNEAPVVTGDVSPSVMENTSAAVATYTGTDPERDTLIWSVNDDDFFWISDRGELYFRTPPSFEEGTSYQVTVTATDGEETASLSGSLPVTVTVTDVEEVGVVTVTPPRGWVEPPTRFEVHLTDDDEGRTNVNWQWARSSNGRSGWTDIEGATFNGYTADAEDANQYLRATVSYEDFDGSNKTASAVRSSPVGDTKPAMNNKPTFTETDPADRSVSAGTSAGRSVGAPVEANDDDPDDILTYSLDGRDADDFDIDAATGQVQTKAILDPLVKDTYEVFVGVHDGFDDGYEPSEDADADIAVIITVTTLPVTRPIITTGGGGGGGGGPANRPPVFEDADGNTVAEISREISEDAALGAKVGEPVVAADPDGDTLAYTLGGDDAASFTIGATTGQLTTQTALDHQTKPDYAVTVVATDPSGATAEIRVAITVTAVSFDCSAGNAVADAADHPGLVADCEALLASRNRLTGDAMLDWSEDTPITEWDGVSLGGTPQRVIRLHLQQKGLDGSIPADLGDLSRLEGLYLDRNELSGPIPPQLGQLSSLVHLTLHRNRFSGEIPADLGDLTALTFLSLYGNELTGELPAEFGSLSNLRWLYLHSNKSGDGGGLSGPIPASFGDLQNLERLLLYGNSFSGAIPAELARLSNLKSLLLHDNEFTGRIPAELGDLSRLRYLWLDDNDLSGPIPSELGGLSSLRWLSLYGNDLSGTIPAELGDLSGLRLLILDGNDLSGAIPGELGDLADLTWLDLNGNDLSGPIPSSLGDLAALEHLYLHNNDLSGPVPAGLGMLSNLTNLWLRDNRLSGQIPPSLGDLPNLQRVRIGGNDFTGCIPSGLVGGPSWYSDAEELGLPACGS